MRRHASAAELASYATGDMRPRKAARLATHLDSCAGCTQVSRQLEDVSVLLAGASFAPMPEYLSARIEVALATEAANRPANSAATDAGRRDLPARAPSPSRPGWKLPGLRSALTMRLVAASGAAVLVIGGAYLLASSSPSSVHSTSGAPASGSRALGPASSQSLTFGPQISVGHAGHLQSVRTVSSAADFAPAQMQAQVDSAVTTARRAGLYGVSSTVPGSSPSSIASGSSHSSIASPGSAPAFSTAGQPSAALNAPGQSGAASQLAGCVDRVTAGVVPALVELAKFEGTKATIIVVAASVSSPAQVWAVGTGCSASASDVLYHQVLKHI